MVLTNVTKEQPVLPLFLFINVLISLLKKNAFNQFRSSV